MIMVVMMLAMPEELRKVWRINFLKAIKKAYDGGRLSRSGYIELRRIANE